MRRSNWAAICASSLLGVFAVACGATVQGEPRIQTYRVYEGGGQVRVGTETTSLQRTSEGWTLETELVDGGKTFLAGKLEVGPDWRPREGRWEGALGSHVVRASGDDPGMIEVVQQRAGGPELALEAFEPVSLLLLGEVAGTTIAVCHVAGSEPATRVAFPGADMTLTAREPTDLGAKGAGIERVTVTQAMAMPGQHPTTAYCRGETLVVAHSGPSWTVAEGAEDLARKLGAQIPE